jgi:nitrile hydratase
MQRGLYNLDQFRDAVERIDPAVYLGMPYYERWLTAIETLVAERGIAI